MILSPSTIVAAIWTVLLVVWVLAAITAKRAVRREFGPARLAQLTVLASAWALLSRSSPEFSALNQRRARTRSSGTRSTRACCSRWWAQRWW